MKKNIKTLFCCQSCGYQSPKWIGRCPECGKWNTFVEEIQSDNQKNKNHEAILQKNSPIPIDSALIENEARLVTGIKEFDRVLGGGIVEGSLVLIGGDPGIGKSTLILQALHGLALKGHKVLYVSGEESVKQLMMRSRRISALSENMLVASEVELDSIIAMMESVKPSALIIDSIQTLYNSELSSAPGSVSQVRESTMRLMIIAKKTSIPVFLVGHVTKEGAIAGPRLLEHMVDTVLYFEGDRNHVFRILRAVKNRFGSTNEIGVFEMKDKGLVEVDNPSAVFLAERPQKSPGSVVTASIEGTRPILVELQALASRTVFGNPRRTILGLDPNRIALLIAVMEKKLGMHLMTHDVFMNVPGGIKLDEPAVDMAAIASIASSFLDRPVKEGTIVLGEAGLTGEVRAIAHPEKRISEIKKMGFSRCIIPDSNLKRIKEIKDIELIGINTVAEAMKILW
ncbi:MAG: DNA repair protein RadA [Desulfobacterales bacterium]|nr:DNA repair protein RadA [Desulfobacterales bacterium]